MRTLAGGLIAGVVLIVAGMLALGEARRVERLGDQKQRIATLQYGVDEADTDSGSLVDRLALPSSSAPEAEHQRAEFDYWRARYEALTPLTGSTGDAPSTDPALLMIAANAMFRAAAPDTPTRAAVDKLDMVIEAYGDALRADPANVDASYNYEYVSRLRETLAKGKPLPRPRRGVPLSEDLPVGPTVHGRPGGPPDDTGMDAFKTFVPLQNDERGELMNRERERVSRGKG
jgi:hypothetical protein